MKLMTILSGNPSQREMKRLAPTLAKINGFASSLEGLSDEELARKTLDFRERFAAGMTSRAAKLDVELEREPDEIRRNKVRQKVEQQVLQELLPEAFAVVREVSGRTLGMRHFDEQMLGGMVLHSGKIAEMRTGEGKTLVATLPAYLNAIAGHGVHVVTVNDYLARRDAQWMGPVFDALGISVAAIGHDQSWLFTGERPEDETLSEWADLAPVTRKEAYAADITYGTNNEFGFDYLRDNMAAAPEQLVQRELWYAIIDEVDSILIDEARTPLIISAPAQESTSLYETFATIAKRLKKETDYTVDEKFKAVLLTEEGTKHVEEWTGVHNLYAPEHVQLVHHIEQALKAQALFQLDKDYVVNQGEVVIVDEFTGRLMPGRRYNEGLHQAIEAKEGVDIKRESDTLATISFQNLFRLYAKLAGMTGTAMTEAEEFWKIYQIEVIEIPTHRTVSRIDHHDLIYKTEGAKLAAVIEEIKTRQEKGQPILIGTISIEKNEELSRALTKAGVKHQKLNAKNHEQEAKVIADAGRPGTVTLATNMAGRGVDIILGGEQPKRSEEQTVNSKQKNDDDDVNSSSPLAVHRSPEADKAWQDWEARHQQVLELGGLFVMGTERHEARRIDNQLRGRSGRQGDPGESQFFVSMDDDLMRVFGGERMRGLMDRLGVPDDQPIQAKMISGAIETAQRRVEGHNFDTRKHLVEYDDVVNKHREFIYKWRRQILLDQPIRLASRVAEQDQDDEKTDRGVNLHDYTISFMTSDERQSYEKKSADWGEELTHQVERAVWLQTINTFWVQHLNAVEALRAGIVLRGYGQHDPLVAYRQEGYQLFQRLREGIQQEVVRAMVNLQVQNQAQIAQPAIERPMVLQGASDSTSVGFQDGQVAPTSEPAAQTVENGEKVGRNDPCPCGSGKKYKRCHGK